MRRVVPFLIAVAALAAGAPPASAAELIARMPSVTPLRAVGGTVAWSQWDPSSRGYRLWLHRDGRNEALPIAPRPIPQDFDLGTDARGVQRLVYTRCDPRCDLYIAGFGGFERKLGAASIPLADESAPTLSRGRLAWARGDGVFTRRLGDARSVRSRAVLRVPQRSCPAPGRCGPTGDRAIEDLELQGDRLAATTFFTERHGRGEGRSTVRLVDLRPGGSRVRTVAEVTQDSGGQSFIGLGFAAQRLGFALACFGRPGACSFGAHRFRVSLDELERTYQARGVQGYAPTGASAGEAYVLTVAHPERDSDSACPCRLERRAVSGFRRAPRP